MMRFFLSIFFFALAGSAAAQKQQRNSKLPPPPPVLYMYVEQEPRFRIPGTNLEEYIREHLRNSEEAYIHAHHFGTSARSACEDLYHLPKGGKIPVCFW